MTAQITTALGTPIPADSLEGPARRAQTHLERAIRHTVPGSLWARVEESGRDLVVINDWLAIQTGRHNCAGGTPEVGYAHEPFCGLEPLYRIERSA